MGWLENIKSETVGLKFTKDDPRTLYYVAAMIDGEGCFTFNNTATVSVSNCYLPILKGLQNLFSGTIRKKSRRSKDNHRVAYEWRLYGGSARDFCRTIHPYLLEKRAQCELTLRMNEYPRGKKRDYWLQELKDMKRFEYYE